jgi:hypothetical protein
MAISKKKRRKSGVSVDFTGVEASSRTIEDGTYPAVVKSCEVKESDNGEYLSFQWEVKQSKSATVLVYDNASLQPQALWRLKLLLETLGEEVPDGAMDIDPDDFAGREAKVEITNEKYDGKRRPRITGFLSVDGETAEEEEPEEEEEDEKPKKKRPSKDEEEDDEPPPKKKKPRDEEEESDDNEDEEDEPPKKKSKIKVGTKVKFTDEDENVIRGIVTSIDGDTANIEDKSKEEWEVELSELEVV